VTMLVGNGDTSGHAMPLESHRRTPGVPALIDTRVEA
jgi:hypothetical protein